MKTSICARYKHVDGWHIFQSDELPGLYVASTDAEAAYNDIAPSIELLLKLNAGIECKAFPEMPFREFVQAAAAEADEITADVAPLVLSDRRFSVMGSHA